MHVRRYEPTDFEQIIKVCKADNRTEDVNVNEYHIYLSRQDKEHYVVELDGNIIAFVSITEMLHNNNKRGLYFFFQVDPVCYGKGIGKKFYHYLLQQWHLSEEEGRRIDFVQVCCDANRKEMIDYFLSIGGKIVHYYQTMYIDIENCKIQPQIPSEYRLTGFTEADIPKYYDLEKEVFTGHFTYNPKTLGEFTKLVKTPYFQWDGTFLLWKGDELIGFCRTQYHNVKSSTVNFLGIREEYRRRGLGRNLLLYGLLALQEKGAKGVMLAVEGTNDYAFSLYRKLGFITRNKRLILEKGLTLEKILQELHEIEINS